MKRTRILRIFIGLGVVVLLLGLAAPKLQAEFECKQELMAGAWANRASGFRLARDGVDIFDPPGPYVISGLVVFDETGRTSVVRNTAGSPAGPRRGNPTQVFDMQVNINPDCTGRWFWALRNDLPADHPLITVFGLQPGEVVLDIDLVCVNGQQECWGTPTVPAFQVGLATFKRIEPNKLAEELEETKTLVRRIAAALGVLRRGE